MPLTKQLTKQDVELLKVGDELILDVIAGSHKLGQIAGDIN